MNVISNEDFYQMSAGKIRQKIQQYARDVTNGKEVDRKAREIIEAVGCTMVGETYFAVNPEKAGKLVRRYQNASPKNWTPGAVNLAWTNGGLYEDFRDQSEIGLEKVVNTAKIIAQVSAEPTPKFPTYTTLPTQKQELAYQTA